MNYQEKQDDKFPVTLSVHRLRHVQFAVAFSIMGIWLGLAPARADVTSEPLSGVTIEDASASPAGIGETSRVRFRLSNSGVDDITLIGIRSPASKSGAMRMHDPLIGPHDIDVLTIQREEELDLTTSHIWGELRALKRPIAKDEFINFELVFRSGAVSAEAHVH